MKQKSNISWTDYTFNPWWGCTRIAPGCDNCYAAALDKRTGNDYWNPHNKPRIAAENNWREMERLHERAVRDNRRVRVFCGSMMDWCDKQAPEGVRERLFEFIKETPNFDWQLLTKRSSRIEECLPDDWWEWENTNPYSHVWLGVTVENMSQGFARIDDLDCVQHYGVKFLSCEPLLEDLYGIESFLPDIDWVIIGGESGPNARPMRLYWAQKIIEKCRDADVPVWFKQVGSTGHDKGGDLFYGERIQQWPYNHQRNTCEYCNGHGEIETDNNGPIVECPVCNGWGFM